MKRDEVVRAIRKARLVERRTPRGELKAMLREESKWKRRSTIASNKLAEVREQINAFALEQVTEPSDLEVINEPNPPKAP